MRTWTDNLAKFARLLFRRRASYPDEIQIEVTNACNLKCGMCPHTLGQVPVKEFPLEAFEALVRDNPAPRRLVLTGWGEPLLHTDFFTLVYVANEYWPKTQVRFTTNGLLLNWETRDEIARVNMAAVTVSADLAPDSSAWSPKWKDILHPPSPKVIRNIREYCRDEEISKRTPLYIQCLVVPVNVSDVEFYIRLAAETGAAGVNLVRMQNHGGNEAERFAWEEEQRVLAGLIGLGRKEGIKVRSANRQNALVRLATRGDRICMRTDDSLYITADGVCTPCCNIREFGIGSARDGTINIKRAWNSERERSFFRNQRPVCGQCDALFRKYR